MTDAVVPASFGEAAEVLRSADAAGRTVAFVGGGTKRGWGPPVPSTDVSLSTRGLDRVVEHNAADLTATLEAGVALSEAQERFAAAGQVLALDPPDGGATIGGVVASGDSGPLRHRFGAPRDLLLGITVALADGTVASAGGRVIKNVAGYDLAKLFAGSFGTLGLILQVAVRLHPLPARRITVIGRSDDPDALGTAAVRVGTAPFELESLDVRWTSGGGAILARAAGVVPERRAERIAAAMREAGLDAAVDEDDEDEWRDQRTGQRSADGATLRVSSVRSDLARVLRTAREHGAEAVGRAGLGLSWLRLPSRTPAELAVAIGAIRAALAPRPVAVLDAADEVRDQVDVWGEPRALGLMRRVKDRFDPRDTCNPGLGPGGR
jgi:glycolate dehydrogenase FAD-binding subunit